MALITYRLNSNSQAFIDALDRQLSSTAVVNSINTVFPPIAFIDATEGDGQDLIVDGNLDAAMGERGFTRLSTALSSPSATIHHWGRFTVANAPTSDLTLGDNGFCTNGDNGQPSPVWFDGTNWINTSAGTAISTPVGGVNVAAISIAGLFVGADGNYFATQASTTGVGVNAVFLVEITSGVVTNIISVEAPGSGYIALELITLSINGITETTACVLSVTSVL